MMDENIMKRLQDISGYRGSAISNYTGECLVCDIVKDSDETEESSETFNDIFRKSHARRVSENFVEASNSLSEISTTFNDIFRKSHRVSMELHLGATEVMEIHTEKNIILMACSGKDQRVHIHIFAIFTKDGSVALAKMALKKILPEAVALLS